jgi:hypothetical protein
MYILFLPRVGLYVSFLPLLTVILTEPWHRRSCENLQNGELFTFVDITIKYRR